MVVALTTSRERTWSPPGEELRPAAMQTEWTYRDLSEAERAEVADCAVEELRDPTTGQMIYRIRQGAQARKALKFAMTGNTSGKPLRVVGEAGDVSMIPFEFDELGQASDAYLARIPWDVQVLFTGEILQRAYLEAQDLEKSALSQLSAGTETSQNAPETAGAKEMVEPDPATASPGEVLDLASDDL